MKNNGRLSQYIDSYLSQGRTTLDLPLEQIERVIYRLEEARGKGQKVFLCGNGGSASTANHFAADLHKGTMAPGKSPIYAESLCANEAELTAWANDTSYENVFIGIMDGKINKGDVLIAISGSGKSENVLNAVDKAKTVGATTIGLTGFDGGKLKDMVDICVVVPINNMEKIESAHMDIHHLIAHVLRNMPAEEVVKEKKGSVRLTAEIVGDEGGYEAYCPELDVRRQGSNREEALNNLKKAAELQVREMEIESVKFRKVERTSFEISVPE